MGLMVLLLGLYGLTTASGAWNLWALAMLLPAELTFWWGVKRVPRGIGEWFRENYIRAVR
ncbi:hypothetical protein SAMN00790413_03428 [Deinococcus hopiensis KR-140]|uniref:DUF418 domain-containing protein n=1 Tax=Deinococcus hopiensis KR-140 TaxID=695939 RepID=A0A1W1UWV0_9DEIO|nr:hypothetical protein SAMN00790413_03428 [Deinococcus hopiensis KR-140]